MVTKAEIIGMLPKGSAIRETAVREQIKQVQKEKSKSQDRGVSYGGGSSYTPKKDARNTGTPVTPEQLSEQTGQPVETMPPRPVIIPSQSQYEKAKSEVNTEEAKPFKFKEGKYYDIEYKTETGEIKNISTQNPEKVLGNIYSTGGGSPQIRENWGDKKSRVIATGVSSEDFKTQIKKQRTIQLYEYAESGVVPLSFKDSVKLEPKYEPFRENITRRLYEQSIGLKTEYQTQENIKRNITKQSSAEWLKSYGSFDYGDKKGLTWAEYKKEQPAAELRKARGYNPQIYFDYDKWYKKATKDMSPVQEGSFYWGGRFLKGFLNPEYYFSELGSGTKDTTMETKKYLYEESLKKSPMDKLTAIASSSPVVNFALPYAVGAGIGAVSSGVGNIALGHTISKGSKAYAAFKVGQVGIGAGVGTIAAFDIKKTYETEGVEAAQVKSLRFGQSALIGFAGYQAGAKSFYQSRFNKIPEFNKTSKFAKAWEKSKIPDLYARTSIPESISKFKDKSIYGKSMEKSLSFNLRKATPKIFKTYLSSSSPKSIQSIYRQKYFGKYNLKDLKQPYGNYRTASWWTRPIDINIMPRGVETETIQFFSGKGILSSTIAKNKSFYANAQSKYMKGGGLNEVLVRTRGKSYYKVYKKGELLPSIKSKEFDFVSRVEGADTPLKYGGDVVGTKSTTYKYSDMFGKPISYGKTFSRQFEGSIRIPTKFGLETKEIPQFDISKSISKSSTSIVKDTSLTIYPVKPKSDFSGGSQIYSYSKSDGSSSNFFVGGGGGSAIFPKLSYPKWSPTFPNLFSRSRNSLSYLEWLEEGIATSGSMSKTKTASILSSARSTNYFSSLIPASVNIPTSKNISNVRTNLINVSVVKPVSISSLLSSPATKTATVTATATATATKTATVTATATATATKTATATILKPVVFPITTKAGAYTPVRPTPTITNIGLLPVIPIPSLYGRGRKGFSYSGYKTKYRFRKVKIPSPFKLKPIRSVF